MFIKTRISLVFLCFWTPLILAQQSNDCSNAVTVCGNSTIATNVTGFGTQELDADQNACFFQETNSIWMQLNIANDGELAFTIKPDDPDIGVDYDFYLFGPDLDCNNLGDPIRCSTTNPRPAGSTSNHTGLRSSETDTSEGPGASGNNFVATVDVQSGETYFLLVDRPHGQGGFQLEWDGPNLFYEPVPITQEPPPIDLCLSYPGLAVDLTQYNDQISQDPDFFPEFFTSYANAFDRANKIATPKNFLLPQTGNLTIYMRVTAKSGCFEILELPIQSNTFINGDLTYSLCDDDQDGMANFSLNEIKADLQQLLPTPNDFNISFFTDEISAQNNAQPLAGTVLNTATAIAYARIQAVADAQCYTLMPISLNVVASPIPPGGQLLQCDVDPTDSTDGITTFNLPEVFNDQLPPGTVYDFFESTADRDSGLAIANPIGYTNTQAFDQTLFYRILFTDCILDGQFQLAVAPTTVSLHPTSPFYACNDTPNATTPLGTFDLEAIRAQNYPNLATAFYTSLEDLTLEQNPLAGELKTGDTTIYVRIEAGNQCQGVESFDLIINPTPIIDFPDAVVLCTDNPPLNLTAQDGFALYRWWDADGKLIANTQSASITAVGEYTLEMGYQYQVNNQRLICSNTKTFSVRPSNRALITSVQVTDLSNNNSIAIMVSGAGEYRYSLDGFTYQDSPIFEDIAPGIQNIFIQDNLGCGITQTEVAIVGYPKFFSPNNDTVNDVWKPFGINSSFNPEAVIHIFNRYGQLMAEIRADSPGWDGTNKGVPLPASDYWFRITLSDGRVHNGHFTLKR